MSEFLTEITKQYYLVLCRLFFNLAETIKDEPPIIEKKYYNKCYGGVYRPFRNKNYLKLIKLSEALSKTALTLLQIQETETKINNVFTPPPTKQFIKPQRELTERWELLQKAQNLKILKQNT